MSLAQTATTTTKQKHVPRPSKVPSWAPADGTVGMSRDDFVVQQMPRVHHLARVMARRLPPHVPIDDLVSAGTLGLMDAARRYDPSLCNRFEAFAEHRIRGAMLDELRSHDSLSRDLRNRLKRRDQAVACLERNLGRAPASEEVAQEMGVEMEEYQRLLGRVHRGIPMSAEALTRDGMGAQAFPDTKHPDPCDLAIAREQRELLGRAISMLPKRLKLVMGLYYREGMTLSQIGDTLGVTEARACQLRAEAVKRIREILTNWEVTAE